MDLTTPERGLKSLWRRGTADEELQAAKLLLKVLSSEQFLDGDVTESCEAAKILLESDQWECKAAGYLALSDVMVNKKQLFHSNVSEEVREYFLIAVERDFEHVEPRARSSCTSLLRPLGSLWGEITWQRLGNNLIDSIKKNLRREPEERVKTMQEVYDREVQTGSADPNVKANVVPIAHETVGWKSLETSLQALEKFADGMGPDFVTLGFLTPDLVDLVLKDCLCHENRYVREVGFDLCSVLIRQLCKGNHALKDAFVERFVKSLAKGLSDNWSQVRYAASVAVRSLLVELPANYSVPLDQIKIKKDESQEFRRLDEFLDLLVPRMCLNRYYLAQGVKLFSQETWKLLFKDKGSLMVAQRLQNVVDYYISQSQADNHAVREAACYCIAELATKIKHSETIDQTNKVSNFVPELLQALVGCFKDESWPVRDASCIASANFVSGFPNECKKVVEEEFLELWFNHLSDNIWSVREDSAVALGIVVKAYSTPSENLAEIEDSKDQSSVQTKGANSKPVLGAFLKGYKAKSQRAPTVQKDEQGKQTELPADGVFNPLKSVLEKLPEMLNAVNNEKKAENSGLVNYIEFDFGDSNSVVSGAFSEDSTELSRYKKRAARPKGVVTGFINELPELVKFQKKFQKQQQDKHDHAHSAEIKDSIDADAGEEEIDEDDPIIKFSNRQMFSCGSLAPKLKRGVGCMDHGFSRKKKQWEITDGAVFLVREICDVAPESGQPFLQNLADIAKNARFFMDFEKLIENIWKNLPLIAQGLGKRRFKRSLDPFIEPLIKDVEHESTLLSTAAAECIFQLEKFIGEEIFRYRVKATFQGNRLLELLSKNSHKIYAPRSTFSQVPTEHVSIQQESAVAPPVKVAISPERLNLQVTDHVLLVQPARFGCNLKTLHDNAFQSQLEEEAEEESISQAAIVELDGLVKALKEHGVNVSVVEDCPVPETPDAVFPNNWISFHDDSFILHSMFAENRRHERKLLEAVGSILRVNGVSMQQDPLLDLSEFEVEEKFLEGTGSLVLDRENKIAYACLSRRTNLELCDKFCKATDYELISFSASFGSQPIYHTNVLMSIGCGFAVVCLESIDDELERATVKTNLELKAHEVVEITLDQMKSFCGNVLQVRSSSSDKSFLVCSQSAFSAFTEGQRMQLLKYVDEFVVAGLSTIERYGGGSARCCIAEIF